MMMTRHKTITRVTRGEEKLRILFVSEYFYPRAAGGEVWSFELCTALAAKGHHVTVMTCRHDDAPAEENVLGMRVLRPVHTTQNERQRVARKVAARRLFNHAKRYLLEHRHSIDVVHTMAYTMSPSVSRLCEQLRIPCMTSIHSYFGKSWEKISRIGAVLRALERKAIRDDRSTIIHVPSRHMQELILHDTGKRTAIIHNWLPDKFPRPKRIPGLLFVGSLEPIKNPIACVAAAKQLNASLTIIGKGSLESALRDAASREGVALNVLRNLPRKETLARIGGADLVLVPSVEESFSLVALEAVAQGTPVAGTPVGIMSELPGVVSWPPRRVPKRLSQRTQMRIRASYSKEHAVDRFEHAYLAVRNHR